MTETKVPFELWRKGDWDRREVAGEAFYEDAIRRLFPQGVSDRREELTFTAHLAPEPHNPHDRNAVAVQIAGSTVGYLPGDEAARYQPVLTELVSQGMQPYVPCLVSASEWESTDWDEHGRAVSRRTLHARITLLLGEPHLCVPANLPPGQSYVQLPYGAAVQISGEEKHMDALAAFLRPEGECLAYATLHAVTEQTARTTRDIVEVRLDGLTVGHLTPKMSEHFLPVIRHLAESGQLTAATVSVTGNRLKVEVVVHAKRAHELPPEWPQVETEPQPQARRAPLVVAELRVPVPSVVGAVSSQTAVATTHAPIPPKPTRLRFNPAPGWPPAPEGWEPFPGWEPDASWPPAPEGWHYWVGA